MGAGDPLIRHAPRRRGTDPATSIKENIAMIRYKACGSGRRTILFENDAAMLATDVTP